MEFDRALLIFVAAIALICVVMAVRDMRAGRTRFGSTTYTRADEPVEYWFSVLYAPTASILLASALASQEWSRQVILGRAAVPALLVPPIVFWLVRGLQSRRIGIGQTVFEQGENPLEFWLLASAYAAVAAFLLLQLAYQLVTEP